MSSFVRFLDLLSSIDGEGSRKLSLFLVLPHLPLIPVGLVGGTIWHSVGGMRNAPKGHRISQAITRVQVRVPTTAGAFAVWGTLFSCFDCTIVAIRQKEDPWNVSLP